MILLDVNLLLYAHSISAPLHRQAYEWWDNALASPEEIGIPWASILAFLRISTSPRAYTHPFAMSGAMRVVSSWFTQPHVSAVAPGERHWEIIAKIIESGAVTSSLVADAHLAALAIEHGAVLCTTDRDFARFPGLRWKNPLER